MKIKLLYFCSDYNVGLTQAQTEQIEHLANEPQIELFCISSEKEQEAGLHERLKRANVNMSIIPNLDIHRNFNALASAIGQIIRKNGITHVNVQNNWQLGLIGFIRMSPFNKLKFKLVYTIHGYRHNHPIKAVVAIVAIGVGLFLLTDRVISMSDYVSKRFCFLAYKTDRVFYMMNKPEYRKSENNIDTSRLSMVFPAQFRNGKRQEKLILSLKKYIDRTNDTSVELHLPGAGPLLNDVKTLAKELGVIKYVRFYGQISLNEVIALYEKTNIALCSSNVETYGRCIAEPFMLGRCVITQKTGVACDIIKHGQNGFFFKTEDDLADILQELYNNPAKIKQVADQAFKDREVFYPGNVMETYIKALKNA